MKLLYENVMDNLLASQEKFTKAERVKTSLIRSQINIS